MMRACLTGIWPLAGPPKKKRKKLRIKPGEAAGGRVVFDDEGVARDPLELVAQRGSDRCAGSYPRTLLTSACSSSFLADGANWQMLRVL